VLDGAALRAKNPGAHPYLQAAEEPARAQVDARDLELIYETCKTYLVTQGKFIMVLELFIGAS
jgi:hypothetical protein